MTLKNVRETLGMTQTGLERSAKVPKGTVHDIESGRNGNPSLDICLKLTGALRKAGAKGVDIETLFSESRVA